MKIDELREYIYIYIYMCVWVCVCVCGWNQTCIDSCVWVSQWKSWWI